MKVITFLNEKGGVGKTTMSGTLATLLAQRNYRVLTIDADSQGHLTLFLRHKRKDGFYHLLKNNAAFDQTVIPVPPDYYAGNPESPLLWLIPGSSGTAQLDGTLDARLLKHRLAQIEKAFDFVIIDTSPKISDLHISFYLASDYIVYPTECTYMPMQGLFRSLEHLETARAHFAAQNYPVAEVLGILPTKFNGREAVQHENHGYLRGKYEGKLFTPIKRLADWEKASQLRCPINMLGFKSSAADQAAQFVEETLARLEMTSYA